MARILIVEDEADQAELFRMALEGGGHVVVGAADDLPAPRAARVTVDLVILDERLGGRSGTALIPRIRSQFPSARILILSADPDAVEGAVARGADAGRIKPVPLIQLVSLIGALTRA
jgi:DNA-binding response OmpR family regulator